MQAVNVSLPCSDHCNMIQMDHVTTAISMITCHLFLKEKIRDFKKNVWLSPFKVKIISSVTIYHTSPEYIFISAYVNTAELLSWRRDPSSIICPFDTPSINSDFSEISSWLPAKLYAKLPIHHISRPFLSFFKICNFLFKIFMAFFFSLSLPGNMGPYGSQNFKTLLLPQALLNFCVSNILIIYIFRFFKFWHFEFQWFFFQFPLHGTIWQENFQNTIPPINCYQIFSNFSWIFASIKTS